MTTAPDPVDVHIGARMRARRKALGVSQQQLADTLGLTFQQVQKYERGSNRISGSKLWAAAQALGWTPNDFYVGLEAAEAAALADPADAAGRERRAAFAGGVREAALLMPEIARIPLLGPAERKAVRAVIQVLAPVEPHTRGEHATYTPAQAAPDAGVH